MKKIVLIILMTGVIFSCNDRLEELNQPTKQAADVPAETLFANGLREMYDLMSSSDVNSNIFRLLSQYWAQTTYPDESQYNLVGRLIPDNFWTYAYRDVLRDLTQARVRVEETAEELSLSEEDKNAQLGIIDINRAYMYSILVDAFGAIPFSEAINDTIFTPKYDAGPEVYNGVIQMVDNAIALMSQGGAGFTEDQDPVYGGDTEQWLKFANSLKLRLAINLSEIDKARATTMIAEAVAGGLIESNDDNAAITYQNSAPNTNPVWEDLVASGRADWVVANTLVDQMMELNDPRLAVYADTAEGGEYIGGEYGTSNTYADNSHVGAVFHEPDLSGVTIDASMVQFWLAEAAEKGIAVPATADQHYQQGITLSMLNWGIDQASIDAYLAQPSVVYSADPALHFQQIGVQAWMASYNNGFEGWTTWRRLDFEGFNVPEGLAETDIPNRLIFPIEEATLNPTEYKNAVQLVGGTDDVQTKVFWDVK